MKSNLLGIVSRLREATAGAEAGELDVHIIQPGWGSSGYYPESVLQKAVTDKVYHAGMHMGWDHPTEQEDWSRPERSLKNLAGALTQDAWYDSDGWDKTPENPTGAGVYSTAKPFPTYAASIKAMGEHIGVSHSVYGDDEWGKAEDKEGKIITQIFADAFNTVDFVTLPGAGGHYKAVFAETLKRTEKKEGDDTITETKITIGDVRKDTKIMEALKKEFMKEADGDKIAEKLTEAQVKNTELTEALKEAGAKLIVLEGRTYALAKVAESKLPALSQKRVTESLAFGKIPDQDSVIDTVEFDKMIEAAVTAEQTYIDEILKESGNGGVHDLGARDTGADLTESKKQLYESHIAMGKSKDIAEALSGYKEA